MKRTQEGSSDGEGIDSDDIPEALPAQAEWSPQAITPRKGQLGGLFLVKLGRGVRKRDVDGACQ